MCVSNNRSSILSRSGFLGIVSAAALPLFTEPARALDAVQQVAGTDGAPLSVPVGLSPANARAAGIAAKSPFVRAQSAAAMNVAYAIGDPQLREDVVSLLRNPVPQFMRRYPTRESRISLRDEMVRAQFVAPDAPVEGIFPPSAQNTAALPFWASPGSERNGHHNYPGGLCTHELFNARMAAQFAQTYDRQYFGGRSIVSADVVVASALYHDIMKTIVFQYRDDGTFLDELPIGGTGAHHVLSGAEAIVRGRGPQFVSVLLSAHAAPSLGDERKVVTWCRAAAMLAGVDPVEYGLLKHLDGEFRLGAVPAIETFVSHLSDHDFVLSIPAAKQVDDALRSVAPRFSVDASNTAAFNWWRMEVTSHFSNIALYYELTRGEDAFIAAIRKAF